MAKKKGKQLPNDDIQIMKKKKAIILWPHKKSKPDK